MFDCRNGGIHKIFEEVVDAIDQHSRLNRYGGQASQRFNRLLYLWVKINHHSFSVVGVYGVSTVAFTVDHLKYANDLFLIVDHGHAIQRTRFVARLMIKVLVEPEGLLGPHEINVLAVNRLSGQCNIT